MVDDIVDTSEVIDSFQDVVNTDSHFSNANGVRLKDIARLVMSQPTTLNVIRIIGQIYLNTVINASFESGFLLLPQHIQKR